MSKEPLPCRYPRAAIQRRIYAFLVDFATVWFISSFMGNWFLAFIVFIPAWLALRGYVVYQFRGQSLGRWAFDIQVIDGRRSCLPDFELLIKRELAVGSTAALAMLGLQYGLPNVINFSIFIAPMVADLVVAIADQENQQAFHDQYFDTVIVPSRRGYSLDIRIRRWVDKLIDRVR